MIGEICDEICELLERILAIVLHRLTLPHLCYFDVFALACVLSVSG